MKTIVVSIGNSDNKLTQQKWADFIVDVDYEFGLWVNQYYFNGGSNGCAPYQNWTLSGEIDERLVEPLLSALTEIKLNYNQESIAIVIGDTQLI